MIDQLLGCFFLFGDDDLSGLDVSHGLNRLIARSFLKEF